MMHADYIPKDVGMKSHSESLLFSPSPPPALSPVLDVSRGGLLRTTVEAGRSGRPDLGNHRRQVSGGNPVRDSKA